LARVADDCGLTQPTPCISVGGHGRLGSNGYTYPATADRQLTLWRVLDHARRGLRSHTRTGRSLVAATNINRVVMTGNLTRDPETRILPSGTAVCDLRLACNTRRKDPDDGEWVDRPNYFNVTAWGPQAESASRYLSRAVPSRSTDGWSGASGRPQAATTPDRLHHRGLRAIPRIAPTRGGGRAAARSR
jgi:hypothetical protein